MGRGHKERTSNSERPQRAPFWLFKAVQTGRQVHRVQPGQQDLASGGDNTLRLWDVATGKNTATLRSETGVFAVAFSPDGKTLATGGSSQVRLWDVATGKQRAMLQEKGTFVCLAFSPDGKDLALGSWTGTLTLWNVVTGKKRLIFNRDDACLRRSV